MTPTIYQRQPDETEARRVDRLMEMSRKRWAEEDAAREAFIGPRQRLEYRFGTYGDGRWMGMRGNRS